MTWFGKKIKPFFQENFLIKDLLFSHSAG